MRGSTRSSGFTLIEVALSVAILGIALTTLVALQSSYLRAYEYERNLIKASLIGQYLLAVWEADDTMPTPGESNKPLRPILDKLGFFDENEIVGRMKNDLDDWVLHRKVSNVGIPPIDNALKKIQLDVVWGPGANEEFSIVYFVKGIKLPDSADDSSDNTEPAEGDTGGEEQDQ